MNTATKIIEESDNYTDEELQKRYDYITKVECLLFEIKESLNEINETN